MSGSWTVKWSSGGEDEYTITTTGHLTTNGVQVNLRGSTDGLFSVDDGWFQWMYEGRTYYIRIVEGVLYVHVFGPENVCTSTYRNRVGYCESGEAAVVKGEFIKKRS